MKKVMVFGAFDLLHAGHLSFFKQAKGHGDFLIAVVARDAAIRKVKGHEPMFTEMQRLSTVRSVSYVGFALLGDKKNKYARIAKWKPDVICLGYDQKQNIAELKRKLKALKLNTRIIRLKPYKKNVYKSSRIKAAASSSLVD